MKHEDQPSIIQAADALTFEVQKAQRLAEAENAAKRQAERQERFEAWSDTDAIVYRKILSDKRAFESLQSIRAMGQDEEPTPIPPLADLPPEVRCQSPSYIRAWVRSRPGWRSPEAVALRKKAIEDKSNRRKYLRTKYPELYGIEDSEARRLVAKKMAEDYAVMSGNYPLKIKEGKSPEQIEDNKIDNFVENVEKYEPGLIARIMSGYFKKKS